MNHQEEKMMKKTKVIAIAMVLMLGLGACGNSKASNTESTESVEIAQAVSETGSGRKGKIMAGDETYQYVLDSCLLYTSRCV